MTKYSTATCLGLALSLVGFTGLPISACAQTDWYFIKAEGKPIGQIRIDRFQQKQGHTRTQVTEISQLNQLQREGSPFEISSVSRFEERPNDGQPLKFSYQYHLNQQTWVDAQGNIEGNDLRLHMVQNDQPMQGQAVLTEHFLFPDGAALQNLYRQHSQDPPGSQFHFQTMHLGLSPKVVDTEVTLLGLDELKLADGREQPFHKFALNNPTDKASTVYEWRDTSGKLYKAQSIGNQMEMVYASRKEIAAVKPKSSDLIANAVAVSTQIPNPRQVSQATYLLKSLGDLGQSLPQSAQQSVQLDTALLQARILESQKEPSDVSFLLPLQVPVSLQIYLQNSPYIQAQGAEIQQTAKIVVDTETRAYYAAQKLQQWVYQNIVNKSYDVGFASAQESLRSRTGDCTEHAVLLAALTRAIGIPSRVVVGLLYQPNVSPATGGQFVYHMWNEIWLGKGSQGEWVPLDATIPEPVVDAARIKLADSPLNEEGDILKVTQPILQQMGQLQIDILQAITPGQMVLGLGGPSSHMNLATQASEQGLIRINIQQLANKSSRLFQIEPLAASLQPDAPEAQFTQGVTRLARGDIDGALNTFQLSLQQTSHPLALYRLGERLISVEMYPLAQQAFQKAQEQDPRLTTLIQEWQQWMPSPLPEQSSLTTYWTALSQTEPERSEMLKRVLQEAPSFTPVYLQLAKGSSGKQAIQWLQQTLTKTSGDFRVAEALGDAWMHQGQYTQAEEAYQQAAQILSTHSQSWRQQWQLDISGKQQIAKGASLLKQNPHNVMAWNSIGQGLQDQDNKDEAQKAFQNALIIQPDSAEARLGLFSIALDHSDWDVLEQQLPVLQGLKGTHAEAARLLSLYNLKTRQYAKSVTLLKEARLREPHRPDVYLSLADLYEQMPIYEWNISKPVQEDLWLKKAEQLLSEGLTQISHPSELQLRLSEILLKEDRWVEAGNLAAQVLKSNPANARAYLLDGMVKLRQQNLSEAKQAFASALMLDPNNANILIQQGNLALAEGREAQAINLYRQANQLEPLNQAAVTALMHTNVLGVKASLKHPFNEDERRYMVQALWLAHQSLCNSRDAWKSIHQLIEQYGGPDFSVGFIELIHQIEPNIQQVSEKERALNLRISQLTPPQGFEILHASLQALSSANVNAYRSAKERLSSFYTTREVTELNQSLQNQESQMEKQLQAFTTMVTEGTSGLPPAMWDAIALESRWDELPAIQSEIASLQSAFNQAINLKSETAAQPAIPKPALPPALKEAKP